MTRAVTRRHAAEPLADASTPRCRRRSARAAATPTAAPTPQAIADGAGRHQPVPAGRRRRHRAPGRASPAAPSCRSTRPTASKARAALAVIDEAWCIGCTLCLEACPVDCIVGAPKRMHTVIDALCTGCELCLPVCPVDCIALVDVHAASAPAGTPGARRRPTQARARYAATGASSASARQRRRLAPRPSASWPTSSRQHADRRRRARPQARRVDAAIARARSASADAMKPPTSSPSSPTLQRRQSRSRQRARIHAACSSCWPRCCCRRRPPTPASTRRRGACSRSRTRRRRCWRSASTALEEHDPDDRPVPQQGEEPARRPAASWSSSTAARCRATREALEALPGVGRKTANVVLNVAFGEPTMAVDTHVFRVANRTGLAPGKTPLEVETEAARARARRPTCVDAHHWLILHGRYVCQARRPLCEQCAVAPQCAFEPKTAAP